MATEFDPRTVIPTTAFDPRTVIQGDFGAVAPPRGALGEVATGVKRGALVGLPSLIGGAMKYVSEPGNALYETGQGMVSSAEARGQRPDLSLQPEQHGAVVNALASGGEMLAPSLAIPAAVGLGAAAAGASPFVATAGAALAGGALFGAEAGQHTLEKGRAAGLDENTAREAARINAATTVAAQAGMGMIGGQMLGTVGRTMLPFFKREGASLAAQTLDDLTGAAGVVKPLLKQTAVSGVEATAVNAGQSALSAGIERSYGIDSPTPGQAAADSIAPTLGLTALMGPLALVTRALNVRAAKTRTESLAHPDTSPEIRTQLADTYAERLAQVDPTAAINFRRNAQNAIDFAQPLPVDSNLFTPDFVQRPNAVADAAAQRTALPALPNNPSPWVVFPDGTVGRTQAEIDGYINGLPEEQRVAARAKLFGLGEQEVPGNALQADGTPRLGFDPGAGRMFAFPDGTITRDPSVVEQFITGLPENQQTEARARLLGMGPQRLAPISDEAIGLHEQVRQGLQDAGITPAAPLSREEFAAGPGKGKKGQALARAYRTYLADPATQRDLMRRDADAFDALSQRPPIEEPVRNAPPDASRSELPPEPRPANSSMRDALTAAFKRRDEEMATQEREAQKSRELDAIQNVSRGAQQAADAEAGRIQGDPNAPMAREAMENAWTAAMTANDMDTKAQARVPFMKRLDSLGVFDMKTHAEQIAALESIVGDKKASQSTRDRASMLAAELKKDLPDAAQPPVEQRATAAPALDATAQGGAAVAGQPAPRPAVGSNAAADAAASALAGEPPVTTRVALSQTPNIPEAKPQPKPIPGEPAREVELGSNLPAFDRNMPVSDMADSIGDRIMELRMGFTDRIRKGEKLSDLEQERYDDLNAFANAINRYQDGRARPSDAEFVKSLGEMVEQASQPYKKSLRREIKASNPNESSPALEALVTLVRSAEGVMGHLAEHGSQPWVKDLAKKLQPLMGKTTIERADTIGAPRVGADGTPLAEGVADYLPRSDAIRIVQATETNILHEAVHAATLARLEQATKIERPANQQEATLKKAYDDLSKVFSEAMQLPGAKQQYGMQHVREFVAELYANDQFRAFLDQRSLLQRAWDGVRKLLGMSPREVSLLQRALDSSEAFFSNERLNEMMDSPDTAPRAMEASLQRVATSVDDRVRQFGMDAPLNILRGVLPLQTVAYIANRARAIPELVKSGFTAGLDAFQRANTSHDVILNRLRDVGSKYVVDVDRMLRGMDESKARAVQAEMMTIGGEASRIGFDFRKNGRDNLEANKDLTAADKPYIDEIHRRWTQLQRTNPEAARLLEEGEKINRRSLIEKVSTIAANLMDDRAGRARRLEAELARLTPEDARRAELEAQAKVLTTESLMASRFAKGLDLLDKTLQQGTNPDAVRFHDVGTANLATRLHATFEAARVLPDGSPLKEAMRSLESMYAKEAKHPYFSLGRDGDFFVKVAFKGIDQRINDKIQDALKGTNKVVGDLTRGDSSAFFRVRSAQEAQALHDRLVAAGEGKVLDTAWGRTVDRIGDATSVSPALRTLLSQVDDMQMGNLSREQADQVKMALTRQLLSMLPETAARNAQMGRRGIPGYDAEFLTRYAQRATGAVHDTAGIYTSRAYMAAAEARKEAIEGLNKTGSADARQRAQLIDDELNKRYSNMMKPMGRDWVANATSLSHSFYLGLSPAFFIRTFVQPWQRGLPFVGSKFGFTGTMAELAGAQATSLKLVANSLKAALAKDGARGLLGAPMELEGLGLNEREMEFVREAHANGKLDLGESSQLVRMASSGNRNLQDAMRYAATTAQYSEMANRFAIGLAAFRLASKRPQLLAKGVTPEAYALHAMEMAMDDFSPANTARAIGRHGWAGQMTPLFAQFQNYNLQTMQQIARTVHDGFFGQDKSPEGIQRAKEARREFAGLMATTATVAGALGMPFANAFAGVYNSLMSDPDDPKDVRIAMRQWAVNTFGREMGTVLMKGMPSLLNVDTATMGQQGILPGSDFLADRTMWKERSEAQVRNALGPAVSLGLDLPNAVSKMMDGYWLKGIEAALPVGLRSVMKTGEMLAGDGFYTDSKGNPTPLPVGASDIAWRALGFQTESKSLQGEAQRDFIINQERLKNRRQGIADQFLKATRDPSQMPDAVSALQGFIAKNPMQPITGQELRSAVSGFHTRFALGEAAGMGIPVSRRQFPVLLQDEAHAAMPDR